METTSTAPFMHYGDLGSHGLLATDDDHYGELELRLIPCYLCWKFFSSFEWRDLHWRVEHRTSAVVMILIDPRDYFAEFKDEEDLFDCALCPPGDKVLISGDDLLFHLVREHRICGNTQKEILEWADYVDYEKSLQE
jgi:hypothetical protein